MRLLELEVHAFRVLREARLVLAPGLNLIVGPNASGKTSVLEAVHVLARGR
ncbi:MAG TPA: DNA replication and repair protein RecF, partial [Chromatiales bacterium]|nr:DNA replication and repair protein RecF [Chromatiales bacterium]